MVGQTWANTQYFNPKQVGNLVLWLDATDPAGNGTLPSNGSALATWVDKSGAGNNVTQSTGANKPSFNLNQLNSRPGITFNGTTNYMQAASVASLGNTVTAFVVGSLSASASNNGTFFEYSNGSSSNTGCLLFYENLNMNFRVVDASTNLYTSAFALSKPFTGILYAYSNGSTNNLFKYNISQNSVASANMNATNKLTIGNLVAIVAAYTYLGFINEIIVFKTAITSAQQAQVINYLTNKWNITS